MDFYKKMIVKIKDTASVLSEKEYKCVSLQAIVNEAIKGNDKKRLKELVEEINGHLADLRAISDIKEAKSKEKCEKLISEFEECLVKILNSSFSDILIGINALFQEAYERTNTAIQDNDMESLKKIADKMERNFIIIKEIPEVKNAKHTEKGDQKILEVVNKYTSLLNKVLAYINAGGRNSAPMPSEEDTKRLEGNAHEKENPPSIPGKIVLNEVEEKLKVMRQKRLNRLNNFVDHQTELAEQRSRESSPKKSTFLNKSFPATLENETAIKSTRSAEIIKPSLYRVAAQVKPVRIAEQTPFAENEENALRKIEEKSQTGFLSTLKNSSGKGTSSSGLNETKSTLTPGIALKKTSLQPTLKERPSEGKPIQKVSPELSKEENNGYLKEVKSSTGKNLDRGLLTKSFAERQIENARNQMEKSSSPLQSSNSTKTPPRTPTQIRKIFNSFNACVLGANKSDSAEDLSSEFASHFEQELKTVQLKNTGLANRLGSVIEREKPASAQPEKHQQRSSMESPPPLPMRFEKRPIALPRKDVQAKEKISDNDEIKVKKKPKEEAKHFDIEKSHSQGHIMRPPNQYRDNRKGKISYAEDAEKWRASQDFDTTNYNNYISDENKQDPTDFITIKRDSNSLEVPAEKCRFSTFRSSTDSIKDGDVIENPIYGIANIESDTKQAFENRNTIAKLQRQNSATLDAMFLSAQPNDLIDITMLEFKRRNRKLSYDTNDFIALEPIITKLEYVINIFRGLKRDESYSDLDKLLSKYYVKVDEIPANSAFDTLEKNNLLERLKKASKDLENRASKNEDILNAIFEEQVIILGDKYGMI